MGIRSDIEEIEIEDEVNTDEDTSLGERQLRKRTSARKAEAKKNKTRAGKLIDKERDEFLNEFDRNVSEREKRKQNKKHNYKEGGRGKQILLFK